jgi:hypothetical protein
MVDAAPTAQLLEAGGIKHWDTPEYAVRLRAANAVATLAFGLMGLLVGLIAFRGSVREGD